MVIQMGLYSRVYATDKYSVVQHTQLFGYCTISIWNGGHDNAPNIAQRYCSI